MLTRAPTLPDTETPLDPSSPLSVRGLTVSYQGLPAISDVSVDIAPGSMTAIIGPNGAGKSTLLKAALGLIGARTGKVTFWGRSFAEVRRRVAYVPQRAAVDWDFPATALDVVLMGLYADIGPFRFARRQHKAAARAALDRVGMADFAGRQIGRLSGGQQQRVFLARALVQNADLTLLDEPFAGVDAATEQAIVAVLKSLHEQGRTIVAVHHDLSTVETIFDHAILMAGRVVAAGPLHLVFTRPHLEASYGGRLSAFDPAGGAAAVNELLAALAFSAGYNTTVVSVGAALLGANAGAIGTFVTLRRRALVSDAMSHATLPGLALAFIMLSLFGYDGRFLPALMLGAVATAGLGLVAIDAITRRTRLEEDVAIGAVLSVFFGAGVVLLTVVQSLDVGGQAGLSTFLLGATAGMRLIEAQTIAVVAVVVGAAIFAFRRAFALVCFDPTFAAATGVDVRRTDLLMTTLLLAVIVIGLQVAGLVLVVALAIIPPAAARFWTERVGTMTLIAAAFGAFAGHVGTAVSAAGPSLPTGPLIVMVAAGLFVVSMIFGRARGLLAGAGAPAREAGA